MTDATPTIIFATGNAHKLEEARAILGNRFKLLGLSDLDCYEDIPETSDTLEGNALQKARWVHARFGHACFADDTGLMVDALGGAPGVYSARYAGDECNSEANIDKLLGELEGKDDRRAAFRTVIAYIDAEGREQCFSGEVCGRIGTERQGSGGFGYDAVFIPDETGVSFAAMSAQQKNQISHRARALHNFFCSLLAQR